MFELESVGAAEFIWDVDLISIHNYSLLSGRHFKMGLELENDSQITVEK